MMTSREAGAMTLFFNALHEGFMGYAGVFACISLGLFFLRQVDRGEAGPGYWAMGFVLNSLGFVFWSGIIPLSPWGFFLIGEILHILGFFSLVWGTYRFSGNEPRRWNIYVALLWILVWVGAILLIPRDALLANALLKGLRAILFICAGVLLLANRRKIATFGRLTAGWSLIAWGAYVIALIPLHFERALSFAFGLLVGFQVLSALGLVAMMIDQMRTRADDSERQVKRLEGLLPICGHCKKIRDENNQWHVLEVYIKDHSAADFSHGICPECLAKHYPNV